MREDSYQDLLELRGYCNIVGPYEIYVRDVIKLSYQEISVEVFFYDFRASRPTFE